MKENIKFKDKLILSIKKTSINKDTQKYNNINIDLYNINDYWNCINYIFDGTKNNNSNIIDKLKNNIVFKSKTNKNLCCFTFNILKVSQISTYIIENLFLDFLVLFLNNVNFNFKIKIIPDIVDIKVKIFFEYDNHYINLVINILYDIYVKVKPLVFSKYNNFTDIYKNLYYYKYNNNLSS